MLGIRSDRRSSAGDDRGQVVPLAAAMVGLCGAALLALVPVAGALDDRARARTAADAAALAGAAEGDTGAQEVAEANGAELLEFDRDGDEVTVHVRVDGVDAYARARGVRRAPDAGPLGGRRPRLANVGGITVDAGVATRLEALLAAARADGLVLRGTGYRSTEQQIALRRAHCGSSYDAIYDAPPSSCSPPTARPGTSMHERGLAVDFEDCASRSTRCWRWLADNAARHGFFNLPSEPWHWSVTGT